MHDPLTHLSQNARSLRESAIRRAGDLEASHPDLISLAPGFPDPQLFPWDDLRDIAASILRGSDPTVLQYGHTRGYRPLLEVFVEILGDRGIRASPENVIVATGSQQALDLCARVFVDPGDVVLVELPTYTGAITAFGNQHAHLVGVRQDADGIDLNDLDKVLLREQGSGRRVALLYVVPNFQNPTGLLMSRDRRQGLLEWARRRNVLIIEDDPYGVLYFDDVAKSDETRPIKADDAEGHVVYVSTFSKTAAPGLRVAWIAGPAPLVARMEVAKQSADLCSGALDQRLVYELHKRGTIEARIPLLRDSYQRKRIAIEGALRRDMRGLVSWSTPKGGFFLWATLLEGVNTDVLVRRAMTHGVLFVPGSAFYVEAHDGRQARFSFSAPSVERIDLGIRRLAAAVQEELSVKPSAAAPESRQVVESAPARSREQAP